MNTPRQARLDPANDSRSLPRLLLILAIPLAALIAVLPMLLRGPSCGHDFDFHLLSWLEAATQFAHLHYPRWAYTPAFNAGEPRFIFYPPLSWSLGALLGLLLPWSLVPAAYIWITLTLAGFTFRRLARAYTAPASATLAATLYLANPYMLFTAYQRSAFAELLAAAWLPLLLAAALPRPPSPRQPPPQSPAQSRPQSPSQYQSQPQPQPEPQSRPEASASRQILRLALPLALIWLSNAPAAVMFSYALALLTIPRLFSRAVPPLRLALTTVAGTLLGLALAAVYIVPAAYQRRFVQIRMVVMEGMRVNDHFLFHRMGGRSADDLFHDAVVRTASLIALGLLAAILLAAFAALRRRLALDAPPQPRLLPTLLLLAAVIAFLLTPASLVLWQHLPQLAFLQFPWRLGSLLGAILALLLAFAMPAHPRPPRPAFLLMPLPLAAALVLPAWLLLRQSCDLEDAIPARVALYQSSLGTDPTDEYTPANADPDALQPHDPPYWLIPIQAPGKPAYSATASSDAPAPALAPPGQAPAHLTLDLPAAMYLVLNRRAYPEWSVFRNHKLVTSEAVSRDDGLIALSLPPGSSTIDLIWTSTPDLLYGQAISAAAAVIVIALGFRAKLRST